jgi:hypothetical protein
MNMLAIGSGSERDSVAKIGSASFGVASAMFFAASALRHSALGGTPVDTVLLASAAYYGVVMLISLGGRIAEFMLCMSVSVGTDLVVSGLALAGVINPNDGPAQVWIFGFELTAMFIAMCRLRYNRLTVLAT